MTLTKRFWKLLFILSTFTAFGFFVWGLAAPVLNGRGIVSVFGMLGSVGVASYAVARYTE